MGFFLTNLVGWRRVVEHVSSRTERETFESMETTVDVLQELDLSIGKTNRTKTK